MTNEETALYYDTRQRYRWQCEEFGCELEKYLLNHEPRNTHHLPQLRA